MSARLDNSKIKTRPERHPIAILLAVISNSPGRYVGGSHRASYESQVTHVLSLLSPMPQRLTRVEEGPGATIDTSDDDGLFSAKVPMSVWREELVMSKVRRVTILPVSSVAVQAPVATSQSLMVVSDDPEASVFESWENATEWTELLCPVSVAVQAPVATSQSLTVLLYDPDASVFELWENATE